MEGQGYGTPRALLRFITTLFQTFCERSGLIVLSAEIDKHGSWEWSSGVTDDLNRSVSLYLTELRRTSAITGAYLAETWAEVDNTKRFARRQVNEWLLEMEQGFKPDLVATILLPHLVAGWQVAMKLSENDLTESFITPREPVFPKEQGR